MVLIHPSIDPVIISFGIIQIRWYSLAYVLGFIIGICFTLFFSTNFSDLISIRIAIGSGTAFILAQLLDVQVFDLLRRRKWFVAPLISSVIGSIFDTFLFWSLCFWGNGFW